MNHQPGGTPKLTCFKANDIRAQLGEALNEEIAYDIGRAYAREIMPQRVVIGGDARASSHRLKLAVAEGLQDEGVDVFDIGMVGTEEIYFATSHLNMDGGIVITASHNPIDYNGMKLVRANSQPISSDSGLFAIQSIAEHQPWLMEQGLNVGKGRFTQISNLDCYIEHLLSYIRLENLTPLTLVVNAGNGAAGHVIDAIESQFYALNVPIRFIKIHHQADASFPNGIPNPLLPENRQSTIDAVIEHNADMGIAWDGDFDRCFLIDEKGQFIDGYYIVGLLAEAFLHKQKGAKIIHDPRLTWNTIDTVTTSGGESILCRTGHAFIKDKMRKEDAIYGGEMSGHHYFRDFFYCDSGMIPWLLVAENLCSKQISLSQAVAQRIDAYPSSGEINLRLSSPNDAIQNVLKVYRPQASHFDDIDGISLTFLEANDHWRFNLRQSNTEPLVRLNVESKKNPALMQAKTQEILALLKHY